MSGKTTSLRLPEAMAAELAAVAQADGMTISDTVREAVEKHIADRCTDPAFKKRLTRKLEKDREVFERLAN